MNTLIAILTAIPSIVKLVDSVGPELKTLVDSLIHWINHVSGNDPQGYVKKVGEAVAQLQSAKSEKEKQDAAKAIADVIQGMS